MKEDGSFRLNLSYFDFLHAGRMTGDRFDRAFGGPARQPEEPITDRHCHIARSIQSVTEEIVLRLARHAGEVTGRRQLCLAGGVALNCVANGRIHREGRFDSIWIQPAAGDSGGALGAALVAWHRHFNSDQSLPAERRSGDLMQGSLLGPEYSDEEILAVLKAHGAVYERLDRCALLEATVALLLQEKVVAWFQGRMEFGPRALGNRSILGDPRSVRMQSQMNLKVKFRESFRPFAPAVLRDRVSECFELDADSPYMLLVAPLRPEMRRHPPDGVSGLERLRHPHSSLPAITHVDYSARIQTVGPDQNPMFFDLLTRFHRASGCPVLINTSFNVRGEPIVCSPDDAYRCFRNSEIDVLAIGSFLLKREQQPAGPLPRTHELVPD
jgi:carbamoyltransferase